MYDVARIKADCDLRQIVESDLGMSPRRGSKAWQWRCPFHHEHKGFSLAVWEHSWRCFGACGIGGDAIDWVQRFRGLSFEDACRALNGVPVRLGSPYRPPPPRAVECAQPPDSQWQQRALAVVEIAQRNLWLPNGRRALVYLEGRGLSRSTIQRARLGYFPSNGKRPLRLFGLKVPTGITIPWLINGNLWTVKVRRAVGEPKYLYISNGNARGLYNADTVAGHHTALFVEGEFDALIAQQELENQMAVVTLGSASATLDDYWLPSLLPLRTILLAYDSDEAGDKGAARLLALTSRAKRIALPHSKDVNAFFLKGGSVKEWMQTAR